MIVWDFYVIGPTGVCVSVPTPCNLFQMSSSAPTPPVCFFLFMSFFVCFCPFLSVSVHFGLFLIVFVRLCLFLLLYVCFLSLSVRFCLFLSVSVHYCLFLSFFVRFGPFLSFSFSFCLFLFVSFYFCPFIPVPVCMGICLVSVLYLQTSRNSVSPVCWIFLLLYNKLALYQNIFSVT